jgi:hypothetical protein
MKVKNKRIAIVIYSQICLVILILLLIPLALNWGINTFKSIVAIGAASSLLAALLLSFLTTWLSQIEKEDIAELISNNVMKLWNIKKLIIQMGLKNINQDRSKSVEMQDEIIKTGCKIFILATTLNSLLSYRTKFKEIIKERTIKKDKTLVSINIILINPKYYNENKLLDSKNNINKLIESLEYFKMLINDNNSYMENKLHIYLINTAPIYFMIGNEEQLIISHYDYSKPGSQPVYTYEKKQNNGLYYHYKKQFDDLWAANKQTKKDIEMYINELRLYQKIEKTSTEQGIS